MGFEHCVYMVECADGSLYTGYATDVEARVAAHNAGKGAKYTKSRGPVRLAASARFYTKERAMSAEWHLKQLTRAQKEALIDRVREGERLDDLLVSDVPGFGPETPSEYVVRMLVENQDPGYRDFQAPLIPTVPAQTMVGVRTPVLRKLAKDVAKRDDVDEFLGRVPHRYFEENQVHAFIAGGFKDYDRALGAVDSFLPSVDNWATCDQMPTKTLAKDPARTLEAVGRWLESDHPYTVRFAVGVLMHLFLGEGFEPRFFDLVAGAGSDYRVEGGPWSEQDVYYVNMMRAWYFAEALAKQPDAAMRVFERAVGAPTLDRWTHNKAVQKARESFRVPPETRDHLKTLRM